MIQQKGCGAPFALIRSGHGQKAFRSLRKASGSLAPRILGTNKTAYGFLVRIIPSLPTLISSYRLRSFGLFERKLNKRDGAVFLIWRMGCFSHTAFTFKGWDELDEPCLQFRLLTRLSLSDLAANKNKAALKGKLEPEPLATYNWAFYPTYNHPCWTYESNLPPPPE